MEAKQTSYVIWGNILTVLSYLFLQVSRDEFVQILSELVSCHILLFSDSFILFLNLYCDWDNISTS